MNECTTMNRLNIPVCTAKVNKLGLGFCCCWIPKIQYNAHTHTHTMRRWCSHPLKLNRSICWHLPVIELCVLFPWLLSSIPPPPRFPCLVLTGDGGGWHRRHDNQMAAVPNSPVVHTDGKISQIWAHLTFHSFNCSCGGFRAGASKLVLWGPQPCWFYPLLITLPGSGTNRAAALWDQYRRPLI